MRPVLASDGCMMAAGDHAKSDIGISAVASATGIW